MFWNINAYFCVDFSLLGGIYSCYVVKIGEKIKKPKKHDRMGEVKIMRL